MVITPVSTVLDVNASPSLNILLPNVDNYKVLLIQPHGRIKANDEGVRHQNQEIAYKQFKKFLENAQETGADLVVTPEYSMPWKVLADMIRAGNVPARGRIWALGCESIKYSELEILKEELSSFALVVFEQLPPESTKFLSPLAYVFRAPVLNGGTGGKTVILVQFKTHPMGDPKHFEINGMQRGTKIYEFENNDQPSLRLISLICADAFALEDCHAVNMYDRSLILHIQLNPSPRHNEFLRCRERLLRCAGDATEIICLNWAANVIVSHNGVEIPWNNISGSAWYLKSHDFDDQDLTLCDNHRRGLYYTLHHTLRSHALFFNYHPATYLLVATKVAHIGVVGPASIRRGPQLVKTSIWDDAATAWVEQVAADDGFTAIVAESGQAQAEIKRIADSNPFEAERVLALCAGNIGYSDDWYKVRKLDSCAIDATEIIRRITFCQDTDHYACGFRVSRLKRCGHLWYILKMVGVLPPALADFKDGFRFEWISDYPHQNAISNSGQQRATLIYMGEDANDTEIYAVAKKAAEYLQQGFVDSNESHTARQRLAVWYRGDDGRIKQYGRDRFTSYDNPGDTSEFDIGRET